ncbi:MAG TPA: secretin N-terminal domain-containing protein [Longimicrobiaceae bacterium]|nr:secretin N-terminal domain-containing protein [Longimicrobiaceae bacterium]
MRCRALLAAALLALPAAPLPLRAQDPPAGVERTARGVTLDFQNADLRIVVSALAEAAGLNVIYSDLPSRPVTIRTSSPVPVSQVRSYLESLVRANGLELVDEGGLLRIVGTQEAPPAAVQVPAAVQGGASQIHVIRMRHAPADEMARTIGALFGIGGPERPSLADELRSRRVQLPAGYAPPAPDVQVNVDRAGGGIAAGLSGSVQIVPDARTNSLLVRANPADLRTILAAVEQLDTRPLQVLIEVIIAEVRRDRNFDLGVDVRVPDQREPRTGATVGGELPGLSAGGVALRVLGLGAVRADVVLRALSSTGEVSILSRPVILAQNNHEARILVGDERPFIQISRAFPTDNAVRDQVIQYRDVGTQLTIRPTINPDGYVSLAVLQEVSTATPETQFGAPVISTREAQTQLLVRDGQTAIIGGLVDQLRSGSNGGIPILRNIPLIGTLFRSTRNRRALTELFLFLTPHVLRTDEDVDAATLRAREATQRLERVLPDSIPLLPTDLTPDSPAPAAPVPPGAQPEREGEPAAPAKPTPRDVGWPESRGKP